MPPGPGPRPPPPVNVSNLLNELMAHGMIEGGEAGPTSQQPPTTIPTMSFTVGTLKQSVLIKLFVRASWMCHLF